MSSELAPQQGKAAATSDGDNRYKAVQAKLGTLAKAMDDATVELEGLRRNMQTNANRAQSLATDIANAELDSKFVGLTSAVSGALGGAVVQVRKLDQSAQEVSALAHDTKGTHQRLYEGLDTIRSGRRERTPRPGFFA